MSSSEPANGYADWAKREHGVGTLCCAVAHASGPRGLDRRAPNRTKNRHRRAIPLRSAASAPGDRDAQREQRDHREFGRARSPAACCGRSATGLLVCLHQLVTRVAACNDWEEGENRDAYLDQVLIGGREPASVIVVDYDERWRQRFKVFARLVRRALVRRI